MSFISYTYSIEIKSDNKLTPTLFDDADKECTVLFSKPFSDYEECVNEVSDILLKLHNNHDDYTIKWIKNKFKTSQDESSWLKNEVINFLVIPKDSSLSSNQWIIKSRIFFDDTRNIVDAHATIQ